MAKTTEELVAEFKARGGAARRVPLGASGPCLPPHDEARDDGARELEAGREAAWLRRNG